MTKADIIFNSEHGEKTFQIASGHISETTVLFEKEGISALIHAKGYVEFYNVDGELLASGNLPEVESGKQVYEEVRCSADGNLITLSFPIYTWIDHYPNCDGEHDRWSTKTIGYNTVTFDCASNKVV